MNVKVNKTNDMPGKTGGNMRNKAPLTVEEQVKLNSLITGWGKLAAAKEGIERNEGTIKRAAAGMDVLPDTAGKIRAFLERN